MVNTSLKRACFSLCFALFFIGGPALAGGGYDTNHPDVRWRTLETDHFLFHWPESRHDTDHPHYFSTKDTVAKLSDIAEKAYEPICSQLDFYPIEKTHVVIYDQDLGWEGNGFAIAEMDWTGFAADWGPLFRHRGRLEFLSDVFVHEYAHIVSLKAYLPWSEASTGFELGGLSEDEEWLRRWGLSPKPNTNFDLGFSLLGSAHTPFWWAEGGAEYWSYYAGTNGWGTSRDAFLRTTFLEDRELSPNEWTTRIDKGGFDGERGYNQGFAFGLYLRERFGTDVMSEMARISGERWHWNWDKVVQKATGVEMQVLYDDWVAAYTTRFEAQRDTVNKRGAVEGRQLSLTEPPWEMDEPPKEWTKLSKKRREEQMDGETAYQEMPRYSPDGKTLLWFEGGLNIMRIEAEEWGAIGGAYVDEEDRKKLKELDKRWTWNENIRGYPVNWSPDSKQIVAVGPEDWAPAPVMDGGLGFNADGYNWNQLLIGTLDDGKKKLKVHWKPVPNTLRATEAAWHPTEDLLAFSRYSDGTHNLWTISTQGENPTQLTEFADGTQVQALNWSPDGKNLVMALYKNHQQDLWSFGLATRAWTRLTKSKVDELDPYVAADGRIYFSSDVGGIYNVYSLDWVSKEVIQHTDVVGSTYAPDLTPDGHLLYSDFTGHGYRIKALHKDNIKQEVVDYEGLCGLPDMVCIEPDPDLLSPEQFPDPTPASKPYNGFKGHFPMTIWPVLRTTDRNVEVGGSFSLGDVVEKHQLDVTATFGKDNYLAVSYFNSQLWPTIGVAYSRYAYKGNYGYGIDEDGDPATDDLRVVDVKFEQLAQDAWITASYVPNYATYISVYGEWARYSFRGSGDGTRWQPYQEGAAVGINIEWSPRGGAYAADDWINPRGGRRVYFDYSHRWSTLLDPEIAGAVFDDGELFSRYDFNRIQFSWTEFIPIPWTDHHTLQLDFDVGFIDKNVLGWDEFLAGGRHPYNWGNGTLGNNIQFSGFEGYSLSGETMLIANAAYRFPLARDLNAKLGPFYLESLYLQVFGSVGNLWSYRVEGPTHVEGYSVVPDADGSIRRELPFKDYAHKNSTPGAPNYVLSDVGIELRIRSFIWNDWDWDSFVRLAYGLRPTAGYGDVNADGISSSLARDSASELSSEIERPTLRVYVGIGTGW